MKLNNNFIRHFLAGMIPVLLFGFIWIYTYENPHSLQNTIGSVRRNIQLSHNEYLTYEKPVFARVTDHGEVFFLNDPVYGAGEPVHFGLLNVGKFKRDDEGKNWVDMDMEVIGPGGFVAMQKKSLLGNGGHLVLENDTAPSPAGVFIPARDMMKGSYTFKLTVFDKIGGESIHDYGVFRLQ